MGLLQTRFVIERINMRRSAAHAKEDHPFSPRGEVRLGQVKPRCMLLRLGRS